MKDLHIHTKYSDGELNELEIINEVINSNVNEFAIADHDTIEGSKRVYEILKMNNHGLIFHPSVELTCRVNEYSNGINVHLLVQDFDYDNIDLLDLIDEVSKLRYEKIQVMVHFVEKEFNIIIPKDLLQEKIKATKSFGKPHLYSILQTLGNFDREKYYRTMDKLDTSYLKLDAKKVITTLQGSCNVVLAHPVEVMDEYNFDFAEIEKLIAYLKGLGLAGLETHHSKQTKDMQKCFTEMAKKYDLYESYGSDFHGENVKPNLKIGQIYKENALEI
ncbi:MAG: hypothetical protein IJ415_04575 [Clostridia bacterium]|nr:hypothetical protein [Clostridia bacterium]